ncbi:MAG: class I SAM-dependent methyltransferase, partial [Chloroflexi bacterium]|nr:class I SAM-dependent methyltransferase [Chloroflexota bacterium]
PTTPPQEATVARPETTPTEPENVAPQREAAEVAQQEAAQRTPEQQAEHVIEQAETGRPQQAKTYTEGQRVAHWEVLEDDYIREQYERKIRRWERGIAQAKAQLEKLSPRATTQRRKIENDIVRWQKEVDSDRQRGAPSPHELQTYREDYIKAVKKAISKGEPVPQQVVDQRPEFTKAVDARARYDKGWKTSFANKSAAINDTMQAERGYKVKRQDGKPITEEQIAEIDQGMREIEEIFGPQADFLRNADVTIAHTSGKHPFLSTYGGVYHGKERTITIGTANIFGEPIPALAHEWAHFLDAEAGYAAGKKVAVFRGKKRVESTWLSEVDGNSFEGEDAANWRSLYRNARYKMTDTIGVRDAFRAKPKEMTKAQEAEREFIRIHLGSYWDRPSEVFARLVEQYASVKRGKAGVSVSGSYFKTPGYWSEKDFTEMLPQIEREINRRLELLRNPRPAEEARPIETPTPRPEPRPEPVQAQTEPEPVRAQPVVEPTPEPEPVAAQPAPEPAPRVEETPQGLPFRVVQGMTNPTRPGKSPRPVWTIEGDTAQYDDILRQAGGQKYKGTWSFWQDPTEKLTQAIQGGAAQPVAQPKPKPDAATAQKLRTIADGMESQIEEKYRPRQANTVRRARMAEGIIAEGDHLKQVQSVLRGLADAIERGDLPEFAQKIQTKSLIDYILLREKWYQPGVHANNLRRLIEKLKGNREAIAIRNKLSQMMHGADDYNHFIRLYSLEDIKFIEKAAKLAEATSYEMPNLADAKRLFKAGINGANYTEVRDYLLSLTRPMSEAEKKQRQIQELERGLIGVPIPGYFPTPRVVVDKMVEKAGIEPGMSVLEPSAGKGNIADVVRETAPDADLTTLEWQPRLSDILKLKGHKVADEQDFMQHQGQYDRIVMNPPFEQLQDVDHVRHAYDLLKPGGRVVAIMSEGPFFRNDRKAAEFRAWLEQVGGTSEQLEAGSFYSSERPTGVNTRMVVIDKPGETMAQPQPAAPALRVEAAPSFAGYGDARKWIDAKAKEYGGKRAFYASEEYKAALPEIQKLYELEIKD